MRLGENDEIVVRGPNVFPGYWNRPQQTADVLRDGWFHTGDQGEMDASGNWRIVGRIKNLIVLGSGHKIAPETIEEEIARHLPSAQQVVIVGNGRGYLSAIVTGSVTGEQVQAALDAVNPAASALQAGARILPAARAILHRERNADREWQAQARPDLRAHEERDRRHVPGEAGGLVTVEKPGGIVGRRNNLKDKRCPGSCRDGVIELALHRDPCNEIGSLSLEELEKFVAALDDLEQEAHALILYSELKSGFCAGADLARALRADRKLWRKPKPLEQCRDFLERIHRVHESRSMLRP